VFFHPPSSLVASLQCYLGKLCIFDKISCARAKRLCSDCAFVFSILFGCGFAALCLCAFALKYFAHLYFAVSNLNSSSFPICGRPRICGECVFAPRDARETRTTADQGPRFPPFSAFFPLTSCFNPTSVLSVPSC
jgi:hypothetical protein